MPPKKRLKQANEKLAKANEARGSGSQSRIALDFEKLREAGWTIKREDRESSSGMKVYFRYTNPGGKTLKSAKDVERQLKSEGIYERFTTQNADQAPQICQTTDVIPRGSSSSDPDYEPHLIHKEKEEKWWVFFFYMTLVTLVQCVILIMNMPVTTDLRDLRNFWVYWTARVLYVRIEHRQFNILLPYFVVFIPAYLKRLVFDFF